MTVHDPPLTFAKKSILIKSFILSFFVAKKTFLLKGLRLSLCFLRCWAGVVWAILLMLSLSEIGAQINTDGSTCCVQSERNVGASGRGQQKWWRRSSPSDTRVWRPPAPCSTSWCSPTATSIRCSPAVTSIRCSPAVTSIWRSSTATFFAAAPGILGGTASHEITPRWQGQSRWEFSLFLDKSQLRWRCGRSSWRSLMPAWERTRWEFVVLSQLIFRSWWWAPFNLVQTVVRLLLENSFCDSSIPGTFFSSSSSSSFSTAYFSWRLLWHFFRRLKYC